MPRERTGYEVDLPGGRTVVMVELRTGELRQALQLAGSDRNQDARAFAQALEGLRMSIRQIDGRDVSRGDLVGEMIDEEFSIREINLLGDVWRRIHTPSDEDLEALQGEAVRAVSGL